MLTRLKVSGFKNLVDIDVRFGPFTCIAGPNGVGKSNLFDAIHFLSALAEKNLVDAALSIRDEEGKTTNIRSLFHQFGKHCDPTMTFEAELIIPAKGKDEFGREAAATITFLEYALRLAYKEEPDDRTQGGLEIISEKLDYIKIREAPKHLLFPYDGKRWQATAIKGARRTVPFISTVREKDQSIIKLHLDKGTGGKAQSFPAATSKRTTLSFSNASESPTAWLAKQEIQSWRQLQLEPSSLRKPDMIYALARLGADGAHLPATLNRLAHRANGSFNPTDQEQVYVRVANRLAGLIDDIQELRIDRDQNRDLLILRVVQRDGTELDARSLSDGSLRFLALAVLEMDPDEEGLICLEEPENGIHPERIPAMLDLLKGIATDVREPLGGDNPLRQVIVNTHSPAVVQQIDDDSLIVAESRERVHDGKRFKTVIFSCLPDTWRAERIPDHPICPRGKLIAYLNPGAARIQAPSGSIKRKAGKHRETQRVVDRKDLEPYFPHFDLPADE